MTKKPQFTNALVDADVLRYRCGFAVEYTLYHVEGLLEPLRGKTKLNNYLDAHEGVNVNYSEEKIIEPPENAIQIVKNYLSQIRNRCGCDLTLFISGKNNFRDDIATIKPYKGNRPDRKPAAYDAITDWLLSQGAIVSDGVEADDLLAINQTEDTIICSVDKDLLQVPGHHYDFVKDEFCFIDEGQGWYNLCVQILAGDPTDNIQGIPKIGIKKAEKILEGEDDPNIMLIRVAEAYESYYGDTWPEFLNENAKLVYMLRYNEDYWEDIGPEIFGDEYAEG